MFGNQNLQIPNKKGYNTHEVGNRKQATETNDHEFKTKIGSFKAA